MSDLRDGEQVTRHWDREWRARLSRNPKVTHINFRLEHWHHDGHGQMPLPRMEDLQRIDVSIDDYTA